MAEVVEYFTNNRFEADTIHIFVLLSISVIKSTLSHENYGKSINRSKRVMYRRVKTGKNSIIRCETSISRTWFGLFYAVQIEKMSLKSVLWALVLCKSLIYLYKMDLFKRFSEKCMGSIITTAPKQIKRIKWSPIYRMNSINFKF